MSESTPRVDAVPREPLCRVVWVEMFPFRRWFFSLTRSTFRADLWAGLTGAVVVLPQGIAFATIAGLPPQYGLYSAMVPVVIAALFGSSHHLVSGPTTPISIILFTTLAPLAAPGSDAYIHACLTMGFLAGVIQLAMGVARMGTLVNFISNAVVVGFTAGAALLVAVSQAGAFLGIPLPAGSSFVHAVVGLGHHVAQVQPLVVLVAAVSLGIAVIVDILRPHWPGMLLALIGGGGVAFLFDPQCVAIPRVGAMTASLPPLSAPLWDLSAWQQLANGALATALVCLIQAVSISRSIAMHSKQHINNNQEFIGQGLSNIIGSFFSAYASSGSFTRSGINYRAGAQSPLAAIFSTLFLVGILLVVAPWLSWLPVAAMAGVILLVAYKLIDFKEIKLISRTSRAETLVMAGTFLATLLIKLDFAIYLGVLISLVYYLRGRANPVITRLVPDPTTYDHLVPVQELPECPQLRIVRVDGSLFFGAVNHVEEVLSCLDKQAPRAVNLLLVGSAINFVDVTGAEMLIHEALRRRGRGGGLFLFDIHDQVNEVIRRSGCLAVIGRDHIFDSIFEAIHSIVTRFLDQEGCRRCERSVFLECQLRRAGVEPSEAEVSYRRRRLQRKSLSKRE
ncbi:MAG: SulP family inorganic anion transporter [Magnetococcales bacterium]|nr:SulP family inorganic anion transporter [Magnetococcales bacterium]